MHHRGTSVRSLESAYADFLRATSSHEGLSNESYVESIIGHMTAPDRGGQYDAVALKYEKPVRTFHQAFNVCFPAKRGSHGKRSWLDFDLETLRECGFPDLELPAGVHASLTHEEERYLAAREDSARRDLGYDAPEPEYLEPIESEYAVPPLALRTLPGPARRGRGRDFRERAGRSTKKRVVRTKKSGTRRSDRRGKKRKVSSTAAVLARLIANAEKRKWRK